jgi:gamma-glutamyltranspeptidase
VATVQDPPEAPGTAEVRPGLLDEVDLEVYDAPLREPTLVDYRGWRSTGWPRRRAAARPSGRP